MLETGYLLFMHRQEQLFQKTNLKLKVVKIRGIESFGMLCSGYELGESLDKEGIIELNKKEKILVINILRVVEKKLWILLLLLTDQIV